MDVKRFLPERVTVSVSARSVCQSPEGQGTWENEHVILAGSELIEGPERQRAIVFSRCGNIRQSQSVQVLCSGDGGSWRVSPSAAVLPLAEGQVLQIRGQVSLCAFARSQRGRRPQQDVTRAQLLRQEDGRGQGNCRFEGSGASELEHHYRWRFADRCVRPIRDRGGSPWERLRDPPVCAWGAPKGRPETEYVDKHGRGAEDDRRS